MVVSFMFGGNLILRWGGCRAMQVGLALLALGSIVAVLPHVSLMFASALALGLGYGLITPSHSHLLARLAPAHNRNLIFSLKQTGVPLGGIGAAAITPAVAVAFGWQWALIGNAIAMALLIVVLERGRWYWDEDRQPAGRIVGHPFSGVAIIWRSTALRLLSIAGACFVIVQICVSTFTVSLFAEEIHLGLIEAGIVLVASQVGGVTGRVFWGWLADLTRNCFGTLAMLAAVMTAASLACITLTPAWSLLASCALFFVLGSTSTGWNGAYLAEVARLTQRSDVSSATGGSLVIVNAGKLAGPIAFANAYALTASYALAFTLLAIPAAAGLACLFAARASVAQVSPQP
jgi:MFS family permease